MTAIWQTTFFHNLGIIFFTKTGKVETKSLFDRNISEQLHDLKKLFAGSSHGK